MSLKKEIIFIYIQKKINYDVLRRLSKQLVDDLMIERNIIKPENKIQNIDKMTILKAPKPENIIEEKDNIFIAPKIKEPLKNQNIDSLLIEGINRPENKIQEVDKMEILRAPKSTNISIEEKDSLFIPRKEKEPLEKQLVDDLMIEKSIKNMIIQFKILIK